MKGPISTRLAYYNEILTAKFQRCSCGTVGTIGRRLAPLAASWQPVGNFFFFADV